MSVSSVAGWWHLTCIYCNFVNEYLRCDPAWNGDMSPEDRFLSRHGHLTTCVIERNNIKINLRSKYIYKKKILKNA